VTAGPGEAAPAPLAAAISAARAAVEERGQELNDLNVFPVADGDTGTNMLLTLRALEEGALAGAGASPATLAEAVSRAALMGARGNSGMILSQLVGGAAAALAEGGPPDGPAVARALAAAADAGYRGVRDPVEGTMLTASRRIAEAAEAAGDAEPLAVLWAAVAAGFRAVDETPGQLAVLREAGVVDAGALGLAIALDGLTASLSGRPPSAPPPRPRPRATGAGRSRYRFCTSFAVLGDALDLAGLEAALAPLGDSLLVMGDARQAKVHVHTDEPERAVGLGRAIGAVEGVAVEDMRRQEAARRERLGRAVGSEALAGELGAVDPTLALDVATTALITDSACDLPLARRTANLRVIPIPVSFGEESLLDGVDLDAPAFYARLAAGGALPTTAQPSPGQLADALREALGDYPTAVVLHLSGRMSGTAAAAREAARGAPDRVLALESEAVSMQLALLVLRVQARLERGTTAGQLAAFVAYFRRTQGTVFSIETLEYLRRGGRIGRAAALAGSLLRVRPIQEVTGGEVAPAGRARGAEAVLPALRSFVERRTEPARPLRVAYAHARRLDAIPQLIAAVQEVRPLARTEIVCELGPAVGTHAGPGTLGVSFVHDPLDEEA
jgi:DegV family protein with EDD domain